MAEKIKSYIEIKGPFQLASREAGDKVVKEVLRLAKEHPKSKFILREKEKKTGFGSVYSRIFKSLTQKGMGDRLRVEKAVHGKHVAHLGPPSEVREAKIKALKPFKVAEFTFQGDVPSAAYKSWQEIDIGLSKQTTYDPLRSKGQHFQSFVGKNKIPGQKKEYFKRDYMVKKFTGASGSATKKVDAIIDKISEYGRKKGANPAVVDAGIQYLRDKSDEFVETQRYSQDKKYKNKEPIHMLSSERLKRLDRLQKNYGTPPKQTGKVNITGTGDKKIQPQVPIQKENIGKHTINIPKFDRKAGLSIETTETKHGHHPPGGSKIVTTRHDRLVRTSEVVRTGTEKIPEVKSKAGLSPEVIKRWKGRVEDGKIILPDSKKGQVKSALRESGTATSFHPVGIEDAIDSAREFDEHSIMSKDEDAPRYPQQSSQREAMIRQQQYGLKSQKYVGQGVPKGQKIVKFPALTTQARFDPENRKYTQFGYTESKKPEHLTPAQKKEYTKVGLKVPTKTAVVIHPFSKMKSGMTAWDKFKKPDVEVTPGEELTKKDWESPDIAEADKGGGDHYSVDTDEFLDKKQQALTDEIAKPDKKGRLPATAIARKPWQNKNIRIGDTKKSTPTTSITDALAQDSISTEYDPKTGERFKQTSATSPHNVGEAIPPYKEGDPEHKGKPKKPKDPVREHRRRLEGLRTESSNIEIKTNKLGKEYFLLKKDKGFEKLSIEGQTSKESFRRQIGITRAEQIKRNYIQFRGEAEAEFHAKPITEKVEHPNVDRWGRPITGEKEHGPMRTFSLKKKAKAPVKTKGANAGSVITKAFNIGKTGAKVLTPLALLGLTPVVAEATLSEAIPDRPATSGERAREYTATFFGSDKFFSGVKKPPGYVQNLAKYDIKALRKSGRTTGDYKPIPGAGGPKTPYAKIKAWMFSKPKTTLPYKSDMATKTDW